METAIYNAIEKMLGEKPQSREIATTINDMVSLPMTAYLSKLVGEKCSNEKKCKTIQAKLADIGLKRAGYFSINMELNFDNDPQLSQADKEMFKNLHVGINLCMTDINMGFDVLLPEDKGIRSIVFVECQKMIRSIMIYEMAFRAEHPKLYKQIKNVLGCTTENIIEQGEWFSTKSSCDNKSKLMAYGYLFDVRNGHVYQRKNPPAPAPN